jgi:ribosomal protein L37AE/L43A
MPNYTPQPKAKDTPSRKSRKGGRSTSFIKNKLAARVQRKERKEQRDAIVEARAAREEGSLPCITCKSPSAKTLLGNHWKCSECAHVFNEDGSELKVKCYCELCMKKQEEAAGPPMTIEDLAKMLKKVEKKQVKLKKKSSKAKIKKTKKS